MEPRWLDEQEMAAWLPLVRLLTTLPNALDTQLREEAGISHLYYQVLVMLSAAPEGALRMSELARTTGMSLSRLSRAVASLEERGWVERRPCPDDRRGQVAHLKDAGRRALEAAAPGHVAEVRRRVFDHLSREQVLQLRTLAERLLAATVSEPATDGRGRATGA
ncbi:MAG: Transcriptional regulator, MarR family [uncultured Frankineae bacterium]|uniref:Transcriptional regulator, MarR family n=1 Tax=uncultured Frankineae bacterium TaxID=437475 RepID=A0A6J4MAY3_9ACTN|nr:MAG: Transcriptional regulator, MarR family [uncultured Frankineae bacterium]